VPPLAQPSQRGGIALAVVLAILAGIVLVVTRVRHGGSAEGLPHAGEAPCFVDRDCGGDGWVCGPAGRCAEGLAPQRAP
jgi:hypothetical protein